MFRVLMLSLLAGCLNIDDRVVYDVLADLPEMNASCDGDKTDEATETTRVVARVETAFDTRPGGSEVAAHCRGIAYARVEAVDWETVRSQLPGPTSLTWVELVAALDALDVSSDQFDVPPAGVSVQVEQFVITDAGGLADVEADPLALVDDIGVEPIAGSDTHLIRVSHVFDGTESGNLANVVTVETNGIGPLAAVSDSFDHDDALLVVTLAEVEVPLHQLGEDPFTVSVDLGARLDYAARAGLSLFGSREE